MIGTTIGNYVVRSKIGEGGMGAVYLAEHARLGRRVAVKVLLPHLGTDPQVVARFFNEAKAATEIKNEHIVDVLDFGELPDGSSYIVMEWLEGQSLADLLEREGRLSVPRTAHIAQGIGKALGAAHARGIVHRDLKPDNVFLVARDGDMDFVKVLDFGIAKLAPSGAGDVRTQTGAMMGTPLYMSPEQINGVNIDQRTDVYALGIMLHQMLAGTLPFPATTLTELLLAHATRAPPPLRAHDPTIPVAVESAVLHALEKDPARRFGSIDELVRAVSGESASALAATGIAPSAPVVARTAPANMATTFVGPPPNTNSLVLAGIGVLAVAVVGTVIGAMVYPRAMPPGSQTVPTVTITTSLPAVTLTEQPTSTAADEPTPSAVATRAAAPPPPAGPTTDRWTLATTDCAPGSMPMSVVTTHTGAAIVTRAAGFPDALGTTSANGKFRVQNALGTCAGVGTPRVVTETCTNALGMSCHATYTRAD